MDHEEEGEMRVKRKVAMAVAVTLVLGGLVATAAAGGFARFYTTPVSYDTMFGSSGNIPSAAGTTKPGSVGGIAPGGCALVGVGDYIPSAPCSSYLNLPYELTETPIAVNSGIITHFTVTTTNAAPNAGNRIHFSVRLCEFGANSCVGGSPGGGITLANCSPAAGSKTCSWVGKLAFQQWNPSHAIGCPAGPGTCHDKDPGTKDLGLIDVVLSRGCGSTCPNGTYDPGNVSWSVAYIK
jgi:hypothetical protein